VKQTLVPPPKQSIPFDLFRALSHGPLITRDGRAATLVGYNPNASYPVRCLVDGRSYCFKPSGTYWVNRPDPLDLFISVEATS
jgi:hypothetical protein